MDAEREKFSRADNSNMNKDAFLQGFFSKLAELAEEEKTRNANNKKLVEDLINRAKEFNSGTEAHKETPVGSYLKSNHFRAKK